jgi:prophage maintenance system killer protein
MHSLIVFLNLNNKKIELTDEQVVTHAYKIANSQNDIKETVEFLIKNEKH